MSIKFYITFLDKHNHQQTVDIWSDSSDTNEVIETFEQDYGSDYVKIVEIVKA